MGCVCSPAPRAETCIVVTCTAGPGTMAMIISSSSKIHTFRPDYAEWVLWLAPIMIALLLGALFFICLRSANRLVKFMGHDGIDAISRIMGSLLVCMGVQLVIDGIQDVIEIPLL